MRHEYLIKAAIERNASDIHIAPNAKPMLRINGVLQEFEDSEVLTHEDITNGVENLCDDNQLDALNRSGEQNFSFSIPDYGRFRVNIVKQRGTYSISIRILKLVIPTKETLGLPSVIFELASQKRGLMIVCGASGSGRSTTMAAILQHLNETQKFNIITVESPIEYLFKHDQSLLVQRDVGTDCDSIYEGVKSIMRHDPDVVMISDISDESVMELALQIAESGKLVIAGLSSINAVTSIETIIASAMPARIENRKLKLASNLLAIIAQQLVPSKQDDTRLLVYELLLPNAAIRSHILSSTFTELRNTLNVGKKQGMLSMDANLFDKFQANDISHETLYKFCLDTEYVKRLEKNSVLGDNA